MRPSASTPQYQTFHYMSANGKIRINGTRVKVDKTPIEVQRLVYPFLKEHYCFILQQSSLTITGSSDVEIRAASSRIITIETFSKPEFYMIVERWGTTFAFICDVNKVSDVRKQSKVLPENQHHPLLNYIKRVTLDSSNNSEFDGSEEEEGPQEQQDQLEDDDFNLMFSSRKIPFVGSFVESHFKVPIHV